MRIVRATHLGMCFGVRNAVKLALTIAARQPLTVLGELVHNETVLEWLRARGIRLQENPVQVETPMVMITAHGTSERRIAALRARGLTVLEATCPLVRAAHRAVAELARQGRHPVVIGRRDHVEVRGLTEDLTEFDVVWSEDDVLGLRPQARLGVVAQTTQPIERVRHLVALIRRRMPQADVRFVDTVCRPTKLRQQAAEELAARCDVVVAIGGAHSNNTCELVRTCARHCARTHQVQTVAELCPQWFAPGDTVGITAGASIPDAAIDAVEARLRELSRAQARAPTAALMGWSEDATAVCLPTKPPPRRAAA